MSADIKNTVFLATLFLLLFALGEVLFHFLKVKGETTRKFIHVGTGLLTLLFPFMLSSHWFVMILCSSFAILLIASIRFGFLKSINSISRPSLGSVAFPVAVYGSFLAYEYFDKALVYYFLPILILAISDPFASIAGQSYPKLKFRIGKGFKTVTGSLAFFLSSFVITLLTVHYLQSERLLLLAFIVAFVTTLAEAVTGNGLDNITIPVAVILSIILSTNLALNGF